VHVIGTPCPFHGGGIILAQKASKSQIVHKPIIGWKTWICFERSLAKAETLVWLTAVEHRHAE
jgi:hypothetical protein